MNTLCCPERPERKSEKSWKSFRDANGVSKIRYSYCSLKGRLFHCVSRSREEAERLCEDWLVGQDRCYRS